MAGTATQSPSSGATTANDHRRLLTTSLPTKMIRNCSIVSPHQHLLTRAGRSRDRPALGQLRWRPGIVGNKIIDDILHGNTRVSSWSPCQMDPCLLRRSDFENNCKGFPYTTRRLWTPATRPDDQWHWETRGAIWILFLLLLGTVDAAIPMTPRTSALQHITNFWLQHRVPFGPPPRGSCHDYMPQFSWTEHLQWALAREAHMSPKTLDPTLPWCIQHRHLFHPLEDFQNAVISDIQNLVFEMEEHTMARFHTLPEHVQRAYRHKDSVTQIPVLIHLLRSIQYPQTELVYRELSEGFPLMGKLTPGINWHVRRIRSTSSLCRSTNFARRIGL